MVGHSSVPLATNLAGISTSTRPSATNLAGISTSTRPPATKDTILAAISTSTSPSATKDNIQAGISTSTRPPATKDTILAAISTSTSPSATKDNIQAGISTSTRPPATKDTILAAISTSTSPSATKDNIQAGISTSTRPPATKDTILAGTTTPNEALSESRTSTSTVPAATKGPDISGSTVPAATKDTRISKATTLASTTTPNEALSVTVQCTKDASFIVVAARDATLPNIDLDSISLMSSEPDCTHVDFNSVFAIYHFPVTSCGSVVMEDQGSIIYENRLFSTYELGVGPLGSITRDSYYEVRFRCIYRGVSVETLMTETMNLADPIAIPPLIGPIQVELRLGNGVCTTKGCGAVDVAYDSYYVDSDYPVTKLLRDPVYIEVRLLNMMDPRLILTLGRCWTTTQLNPHSRPQWDILVEGCPNQGDRYRSTLIPIGPSSGLQFPSHYRRFIFQMFTFVDQEMSPLKEQVYIHCSTEVCTPGQGEQCEPSCGGRKNKRDVAATAVAKEPRMVMTVGPLLMGRVEEAHQVP
ncbi:unnamed protein product [Arctogadus glacialis]